jgi:hypothetical protein
MVFFVVGVTGFSAGLRLACASRGARSRLRYPAAENDPLDRFSSELREKL